MGAGWEGATVMAAPQRQAHLIHCKDKDVLEVEPVQQDHLQNMEQRSISFPFPADDCAHAGVEITESGGGGSPSSRATG